MASLQKTYTGDLTVAIAKKILAAILKKREKNNGVDLDDDSEQSNPNAITSIVPTPKNPLGGSQSSENFDKGDLGKAARLDPELKKKLIQERMRPMGRSPIISAERGFFPRAFNDGIQVREKKLGTFLEKVALSLSSSLNTINQKMDETNEGVIAAKDGIDRTYKKLEQNSDSLEEKLDAIVDALRFSNRSAEEKRDKNEASAKESFMQQQVDLSNANRILMQDMDRQEIRDMQAEDLAEDDRGPIGMDDGGGGVDPDDLPRLDRGGIVSGPDSGYLAVLHGDEAVIPLDNNYTQGQPSAVGKEPISQMPMMAERGITPGDNPSSMKPKFTINTPSSSPVLNIGSKMSGSEDLAKAIELPSKIAGLVTGGLMTNVLSNTMLPEGITKHIKNITSPIMEAFGVGDLASNLTEGSEDRLAQTQKRQSVLSVGMGKRGREKGVLQKIKEFIFGTGGGSMTYRGGTGGNTYMNNRTSGTGGYGIGGYGYGYGGNKIASTPQDGRTPTRLFYNSPYKSPEMFIKDKQAIEDAKERFKLFTGIDLATGDSQFFSKNVTYNNAFDYNKFNSPEYGLKTSNVAYNMSMEDEVDSIVDGLSEPESQIIMNNQTASNNADNQIEYSAIQVRGNPLKKGTYVSPYSV